MLNNNSNKITEGEIKHIAKLANINLSEKDLEKFNSQLSEILEYVGKLQKVNTEKLKPSSWIGNLKNVFREDKILPSLEQKSVLSNAKETHNGYFKIKAIFE